MSGVALVTGAAGGLGRKIALALAAQGYAVAVNYFSSADAAVDLAGTIGRDSLLCRADVGDSVQVALMAGRIEERFGRLDVIINNSGVARDNLLIRQSEREWDETIAVNLKGCFNVTRILAPLMISSGGGHIVNISSYSGIKGKPGQAAYSASKAALIGLTRTSAAELAQYDIRVNAVLPGYMATEMGEGAEQAMEEARRSSLLGRLSDPEEIARFIVSFLATRNVTGQIFGIESRIV